MAKFQNNNNSQNSRKNILVNNEYIHEFKSHCQSLLMHNHNVTWYKVPSLVICSVIQQRQRCVRTA